MGEMERVLAENREIVRTYAQPEEADTKPGYSKLQEQLYKKFDCAELNKRRLPVKVFQDATFFKRDEKDELFDHKPVEQNDFPDRPTDSTRNPIRGLMNSSILGGGKEENEHKMSAFQRSKNKRLPKKPATKAGSQERILSATQRNLSVDSEKQHPNEFEVSESEERACIKHLNRNIKFKKPNRSLSLGSLNNSQAVNASQKRTPLYVDIDNYFEKHVEHELKSNRNEPIKPLPFSEYLNCIECSL